MIIPFLFTILLLYSIAELSHDFLAMHALRQVDMSWNLIGDEYGRKVRDTLSECANVKALKLGGLPARLYCPHCGVLSLSYLSGRCVGSDRSLMSCDLCGLQTEGYVDEDSQRYIMRIARQEFKDATVARTVQCC
jgi:transcription elongation factor Elf1